MAVGQTTLTTAREPKPRLPLILHRTDELAAALVPAAALELAGARMANMETSRPATATTTADRFAVLSKDDLTALMVLTP